MHELLGFPFVDQLASVTSDGQADENSHMNCVPSCIAACLMYLTGKKYNPDQIKDAVYGQGYTGGTSALDYVVYAYTQKVKLYAVSGNPSYLVSQIQAHIAMGHPVIGTIPSTYAPPADAFNPGMSHVIAFYQDDNGVLGAMNPWHAFTQAGMTAWWAARLCFGQVWVAEKIQEQTNMVPQGWKDDGSTLTAPNGKRVLLGFRQWVLAHSWHPDDVPLEFEHGSTLGKGGTEQLFMSKRLRYTPARGVYEEFLGPEVLYPAPSVQAPVTMKEVLAYLEGLKV